MPGKAAKVIITERQEKILKRLCSAKTGAAHLRERASIILLAFSGLKNEQIAAELGMNRQAVGTWRRRWQGDFDKLVAIECTETKAALRRGVIATLSDTRRSGRKMTFTAEQVTQILALACEPPENSGRPITHWTHRELADEAIRRGIVSSISASQVGRYLREAELQPHHSRYWLNAKARESDPEKFRQDVIAVCACYRMAPELCSQFGTHTVCVDEMTGLQALERAAATIPMQRGKAERREFEYIRHGTQTLIGSFDVVTGKLLPPTVQATRTEQDFVDHIAGTVATAPDAPWIIVLDNLNIHCSESLVSWVAMTCGLNEALGKKRQTRSVEVSGQPHRLSV